MKRTLSAITAALAAFAAISAASMTAAAEAQPPDLLPPDWVPSSFAEAMQFVDSYGATHIEGDYVCIVMDETTSTDYSFSEEVNFHCPENLTCADPFQWHCTYAFEAPEKPDEATATREEIRAYEQLCAELGYRPDLVGEDYDPGFRFQVWCWQLTAPETGIDFTRKSTHLSTGTVNAGNTYSFAFNTAAQLTETDIFGWLPDSVPEFRTFKEENDTVSLQNGYIVYADDVCYDGGISLLTDQKGTALVECIRSSSPSYKELVPSVGGTSHLLKVYQVKRPGTVKMRFTQMRTFADPANAVVDDQIFCFEIAPNDEIKPIEEEKVEILTRGDSSGDGEISIADAAVLQKYLLGLGDITYWQNADLNNDSRLSAADFSLLKQMLLAQTAASEPETAELPPVTEDLVLCTEWLEKGLGGYTVFTADCSLDFRLNFTLNQMYLYDADTNEQLSMFGSTGMGTPHLNLRTTDITEECVKRYYAVAECTAIDGTAVKLRTNTLSIHFCETPAP